MSNYIAGYQNAAKRAFYVSHRRGDGGKDWGYTMRISQALTLSERMAKIYQNEVPGRFIQRVQS